MTYRVVKWVKGRAYLYSQRSFRDGKAVRTVSTFLGAASAADISTCQQGSRSMAGEGDTAPHEPKAPRGRGSVATGGNLTISANLERAGVSERAFRYHYSEAARRLSAVGIDPAHLPPVSVRYGLGVAMKPRWRGGYAVTLPPGSKVNRRAVSEAYHKAIARASLDAMRQQQPERFATLSLQMDASFRATNAAVLQYVSNTRHRDAWAWGLALRWFGVANALKGTGGSVAAETIGLAEYGSRATWQDETSAVLGQVLAKGYRATHEAHEREAGKARAAEKAAALAYKNAGILSRRAARKTWRKSSARVIAQHEMGAKLATIRAAFGFDE